MKNKKYIIGFDDYTGSISNNQSFIIKSLNYVDKNALRLLYSFQVKNR